MPARWFVPMIVGLAGLTAASPGVLARQQGAANQPGMPTLARVEVINSASAAVPVVIRSGSDVQPVAVMSAPPLSLAPNAMVAARLVAQRWEYRIVGGRTNDEVTAALNRMGEEGWEAVGLAAAPPPAGGWQVLAKRPR